MVAAFAAHAEGPDDDEKKEDEGDSEADDGHDGGPVFVKNSFKHDG